MVDQLERREARMAKKEAKKANKEARKKKGKGIKNPLQVTKDLQAIGESYSRYSTFLIYICIIALSVVMGILFMLPVWMVAVCCVVYAIMTPTLMYNFKKQKYEKQRFEDLNSYLTQMNQSFTSTHNILVSLKETAATFTNGRMKSTITEAIEKIETSYSDVRIAEEEALNGIASSYDCEKIRTLHDFLIRAESRGGDCTEEFKILSRTNNMWKKVVLDYYKKMTGCRNIVAIYYFLLIGVCIFMLRNFPDMFDLIRHPIVQWANMIEIILFILVFAYTDSKLNISLLRDAKFMSEKSANSANEYVHNFDNKTERRKYRPLIILSFIVAIALFVLKPGGITAILCVGFVVLVFNMHKLTYYLNWLAIKSEATKAFPKWLFDVLLLMQRESVEGAIYMSRDYAPPILSVELNRICDMLDRNPGDPDAYMSFLAEYKIMGVESAMRNLYALSVGTGNREVMINVIDDSMIMLENAERKSMKNKGDLTTGYQFIPVAIVSLGMIAYLVALVLEVFVKVGTIMNF